MYEEQFQDPSYAVGNSFGAQVGSSIGASAGIPPESAFMRAMGHFPRGSATAGWNALRGSNAMMYGGFQESLGGSHMYQRMVNHLTPQSWGRLSSTDAFASQLGMKNAAKGPYSVFNFLAQSGNSFINNQIRREFNSSTSIHSKVGLTKRLVNHSFLAGDEAASISAEGGKNVEFFSPGMWSRATTAARLRNADLANPKTARAVENTMRSLNKVNGIEVFGDVSPRQASQYALMASGHISQYAGGYVAGVHGGLDPVVEATARGSGREYFLRGASKAAEHLSLGGVEAGGRPTIAGFKTAWQAGKVAGREAGEVAVKAAAKETGEAVVKEVAAKTIEKEGTKVAAKFAAKYGTAYAASAATGPLMPVVDAALTAWMVYDLAKMGKELIVPATKQFAQDAYKSLQGSWNKPVMGMGYKDNTVAATSRQRGVMAIQNSRLNMRSVIGSEAGMMAAHFG